MESGSRGAKKSWKKRAIRFSRQRRLIVLAVAALLLFALTTNAFADIPDQGRVINACVRTKGLFGIGSIPYIQTPNVRIIDTDKGQSCNRYETAVSWNQNGATGPIGPAGATGAAGPSGPSGPAGVTGIQGPTGVTGMTGPSGPAGTAGLTGATGATGLTGPSGPAGASGPTGATGIQGESGPTGETGATGLTGQSGPVGASGPSGPSGASGVSGPSGPVGESGAQGPSGPSGPAGDSGPSGPSGPSGSGLAAYASVSSTAIQVVAPLSPIVFNTTESANQVIISTAPPGLTVQLAGTYHVSFTASPTTASQFSIRLDQSGTDFFLSGCTFGTAVANTQITGQCDVILQVGDMISLINTAVAPVPVNASSDGISPFPNVNASLSIEKID